jgi:hypothetical protein
MEALAATADAADLVEKIHVPGAAAHLAVADALEADIALQRDRVADRPILGGAQLGGREATGLMLGTRLEQLRRAQQAADVIGAKRRCGHVFLPVFDYQEVTSCYPSVVAQNNRWRDRQNRRPIRCRNSEPALLRLKRSRFSPPPA